jgi:hypothetical protein
MPSLSFGRGIVADFCWQFMPSLPFKRGIAADFCWQFMPSLSYQSAQDTQVELCIVMHKTEKTMLHSEITIYYTPLSI